MPTELLVCVLFTFIYLITLIVTLRRDNKNKKKELAALRKNIEITEINLRGTIEHLKRYNKGLENTIKQLRAGWFPASYNNSRHGQGYACRFKRRYTEELITENVKHFTVHGPVFNRSGLVKFDELLIFIDVA